MGKRKKNTQNVVKIDLNDTNFGKTKLLAVVVRQVSKDGRRVDQTVHRIPTSQQNPPPPTFSPSPVVDDTWDNAWDSAWDHAFPDDDDDVTQGEANGPEPVRLYSLSFHLP